MYFRSYRSELFKTYFVILEPSAETITLRPLRYLFIMYISSNSMNKYYMHLAEEGGFFTNS